MTNEERMKFHDWLLGFPGLFEGASPGECIAKAYQASPLDIGEADFKALIHRHGFRVRCTRNTPPIYRLEMGTPGVGVTGAR